MLDFRRLDVDDCDAAADLHRVAGALIPGYDTSLHTPAEFRALYHGKVIVEGPAWGAFEDGNLRGFVALLPGWIEHLYVDPQHHRAGIGSALVTLAQREQADLQLHTFQSNTVARRMYERHGFIAEEFTDGQGNEERMPDVRYRWVRG